MEISLFHLTVFLSLTLTVHSQTIRMFDAPGATWTKDGDGAIITCRWDYEDMEGVEITRQVVTINTVYKVSQNQPSDTFNYDNSPIKSTRMSTTTNFEEHWTRLNISHVKITDPKIFTCEVELNTVQAVMDYPAEYYALPEVLVSDGVINTSIFPIKEETDDYYNSEFYGGETEAETDTNSTTEAIDTTDTDYTGGESIPEEPEYMDQEASNSTTTGTHPNITVYCTVTKAYPKPTVYFVIGRGESDEETIEAVNPDITQNATSLYWGGKAMLELVPDKKYDGKTVYCKVSLPIKDEPEEQWSNEPSSEITVLHPNEYVNIELADGINPNTIREGDPVTFICSGDGNPAPTYTITPEVPAGSSPGTFTFLSVGRNNADSYRCIATSQSQDDVDETIQNQSMEEITIDVHYLEQPAIQEGGDVTIVKGEDTTFNCIVNSHPYPDYEWYKDGKFITGESSSSLTIRNAQYNQAGVYKCKVTAGYAGSKSVEVTLRVEGSCTADLETTVISSSADEQGHFYVQLDCYVTGYPECEVDMRSEDKLQTQGTQSNPEEGHYRLTYGNLPMLTEATKFFCYADNSAGAAVNVSITIDSSTDLCCAVPKASGLGTGAIIGIILLVIVVIIGIPVACYLVRKRNSQPKMKTSGDAENAEKEEKEGLNKDASSERAEEP